jgi:hypothetical protein
MQEEIKKDCKNLANFEKELKKTLSNLENHFINLNRVSIEKFTRSSFSNQEMDGDVIIYDQD